MPVKGGKLTPKEAQFIGHMAATGDATYAAKMSGYSHATIQGWQKANNPELAGHVRRAQVARLNNDLLPLSLDVVGGILLDKGASNRDKLTAAQVVLKYTLGASERGEEKAPEDMTPAEIQARIDQLRRAAADKARPVIEGQVQAPDPGVFD
jgi:hypothetical protein